MGDLLKQIHQAAGIYRRFVTDASAVTGPVDRLTLFGYRTGVLESEVIKPLILYLLDPQEPRVQQDQFLKTLEVVESWMVRRMLVRATTKAYNQVVAELVSQLRRSDRTRCGDLVESFLTSQKGTSRYWPDDDELATELRDLLAYRRFSRARLRMVLEAIEDHLRGWKDRKSGLGEERVARGTNAIEHVMPRKWADHWPPAAGFRGEADRDRLVHTVGNLTLLPAKLNSKASNAPWLGSGGKRETLEHHDVFMLNRRFRALDAWTDDAIRSRTDELVRIISEIWPVPSGHRSGFAHERPKQHRKVKLVDLLYAGKLTPGMPLFPRRKKKYVVDRVATLLPDGQIDVDGQIYEKPSAAAEAIAGKKRNGMWFFLVDQASRRSLRDVWRDYVEERAVDADEEEGDEEEGEGEDA